MKKRWLTLLVCLFISTAPAFATTTPVADARTVTSVKALFVAMDMRGLVALSLKDTTVGLPEMLRAVAARESAGESSSEQAEAMRDIEKILPGMVTSIDRAMSEPALLDEIVDANIEIYAGTFTLAEIEQLTAFYKTPLGKVVLAKMTALTQKSMEQVNAALMPRLTKAISQGLHMPAKAGQ